MSNSQYTISIITKHASDWLDNGLAGVENKEIVSALIGQLIMAERRQDIRVTKVKVHSGDAGNDGVDELVNQGAQKATADEVDTEIGVRVRNMGARVPKLTQAKAYSLIKERTPPMARTDTERVMGRVIAALEEYNGVQPTPQAVWKEI